MKTARPPILYGAVILAVLSLAWSAYAIADLMNSGRFGLSVALAGDVGWITVLWAEYKGVTLAGRRWAAVAAGWVIALGVAALLVIHGNEVGGRAQAIAGPFVVLVGKIVWAFALEAMRDPAGPTPEQQAELNAVLRDSAHEAGMLHARANAKIARIRAEASVTLARDEADFEIGLERLDKQAEIYRHTRLALPPATPRPPSPGFGEAAEQAVEVAREARPDSTSGRPDVKADTSGQSDNDTDEASGRDEPEPAATPLTSPDTRPDSPDPLSEIAKAAAGPAELVRSLATHGVPKDALVSEAVRLRPDMVADSIRRTVKRLGEGPYL